MRFSFSLSLFILLALSSVAISIQHVDAAKSSDMVCGDHLAPYCSIKDKIANYMDSIGMKTQPKSEESEQAIITEIQALQNRIDQLTLQLSRYQNEQISIDQQAFSFSGKIPTLEKPKIVIPGKNLIPIPGKIDPPNVKPGSGNESQQAANSPSGSKIVIFDCDGECSDEQKSQCTAKGGTVVNRCSVLEIISCEVCEENDQPINPYPENEMGISSGMQIGTLPVPKLKSSTTAPEPGPGGDEQNPSGLEPPQQDKQSGFTVDRKVAAPTNSIEMEGVQIPIEPYIISNTNDSTTSPTRPSAAGLGEFDSTSKIMSAGIVNPFELIEKTPIWQVEVLIKTADIKDAGTDDSVFLELGDLIWLDSPKDDFERGGETSFIFTPEYFDSVGNVQNIKIGKEGNDGWCIDYFEVKINGIGEIYADENNRRLGNSSNPIYSHDFNNLPEGCLWLDSEPGFPMVFIADYNTLRSSSSWKNWQSLLPPTKISSEILENRIEVKLGNLIDGERPYWADEKGVEITRVADDTIHVETKLKVDIPYFFDPDLDLSYDIEIGCNEGSGIYFTSYNEKVTQDYSWMPDRVEGVLEKVGSFVGSGFRSFSSWDRLMDTFDISSKFFREQVFDGVGSASLPGQLQDTCPEIKIRPDGSLEFFYQ